MIRTIGLALALVAAFALTACAPRYPLGMSEEEWQALTPDQQHEARVADAEAKRAKAEQAAAEANAKALEQRNKLIEAYRRAGKGDIVECEIIPPADTSGDIKVRPSSVTLVRGEDRRVQVYTGQGGRSTFAWVRRGSGGDVEFCGSTSSGSSPAGACNSIRSLALTFDKEPSTEITWVSELSGGKLTCHNFTGNFGPSGIPSHLR